MYVGRKSFIAAPASTIPPVRHLLHFEVEPIVSVYSLPLSADKSLTLSNKYLMILVAERSGAAPQSRAIVPAVKNLRRRILDIKIPANHLPVRGAENEVPRKIPYKIYEYQETLRSSGATYYLLAPRGYLGCRENVTCRRNHHLTALKTYSRI